MEGIGPKDYPIVETQSNQSKNIIIQSETDFNASEKIKTATYYLNLEDDYNSKENQDVSFESIENEQLQSEAIEDSNTEYVALEVQNSNQIILHEKDVILWSELCRICANGCDQFVPIFTGEGLEINLSQKIREHLPVQISENDNLPHQLCYNCAATLVAYDDMYKGCLDAQERLSDLHNKLNVKDQFANDAVETENEDFDSKSDKIENDPDVLLEESVKEVIQEENFGDEEGYFKFEDEEIITVFTSQSPSSKDENVVKVPKKQQPKLAPLDLGVKEARRKELTKVTFICDGATYYQCSVCRKILSTPYNYFTHKRIHTNEKPCTCQICNKSFTATSSLSRHVREVHEKIKEYGCSFCERMLASKVARDEHERTHTNERPHVCEVCHKSFRQRASLSVHRRFHSKDILYHCKQCNRGFPRKQDKERHELTHTDQKPYGCKYCSKAFRSSASAIRHRLTHETDGMRHICDVCGDLFTQERYLKNHYKKFHKDR